MSSFYSEDSSSSSSSDDSSSSSSSSSSLDCSPKYDTPWLGAKLGWSANYDGNAGEWVSIDIGFSETIIGVVTQGILYDGEFPEYVTSFRVQTSVDGVSWSDVEDEKIFWSDPLEDDYSSSHSSGSHSSSSHSSSSHSSSSHSSSSHSSSSHSSSSHSPTADTKVFNKFSPPVQARYLKIFPLTWESWPSLRFGAVLHSCRECDMGDDSTEFDPQYPTAMFVGNIDGDSSTADFDLQALGYCGDSDPVAQCPCFTNVTPEKTSGSIHMMGEDYADDLDCVWIIEGYRPMIEFTYFNIEDGGVVRVDDGESVLHEIRGRRGAEDWPGKRVTSSTGRLLIKMKRVSQWCNSHSNLGIKISWRTMPSMYADFDPEVTTFAGKLMVSGSSDGVGTAATFNAPSSLTVTPDRKLLLVADRSNNLIRAIDMKTKEVRTLAGRGTWGYNDGPRLTAQFASPRSIIMKDDSYALIIDDSTTAEGNSVLRMVHVQSGATSTFLQFPQGEFQHPAAVLRNPFPETLGDSEFWVLDANNGAPAGISLSGVSGGLTAILAGPTSLLPPESFPTVDLIGNPISEPTLDYSHMFCVEGTSGMGIWTEDGTLELTVCEGEIINTGSDSAWGFAFHSANPSVAMQSPDFFVSGSSSLLQDSSTDSAKITFAAATVNKPGTLIEVGGVAEGADPWKIVVPALTVATVAHSNFIANAVNTITLSFSSNFNLQTQSNLNVTFVSNFLITNMKGVLPFQTQNFSDSRIVELSEPGELEGGYASASSLFCAKGNDPGTALLEKSNLVLRVCDGALLQSGQKYAIAVMVKNPDASQECPPLSIEGQSGIVEIDDARSREEAWENVTTLPRGVDASMLTISGVVNASCALRTFKPTIHSTYLAQSNPFANQANNLTLRFQIDIDMHGVSAKSARISLVGLDGLTYSGSAVPISIPPELAKQGPFCLDAVGDAVYWRNGTLVTYVCDGEKASANQEYLIVFPIKNPSVERTSPPAIAISGHAPEIQFTAESSETGTPFVSPEFTIDSLFVDLSHDEIFSVSSGASPLVNVWPGFDATIILQQTPIPQAENMIFVGWSMNYQQVAPKVTIQGLNGARLSPGQPYLQSECTVPASWTTYLESLKTEFGKEQSELRLCIEHSSFEECVYPRHSQYRRRSLLGELSSILPPFPCEHDSDCYYDGCAYRDDHLLPVDDYPAFRCSELKQCVYHDTLSETDVVCPGPPAWVPMRVVGNDIESGVLVLEECPALPSHEFELDQNTRITLGLSKSLTGFKLGLNFMVKNSEDDNDFDPLPDVLIEMQTAVFDIKPTAMTRPGKTVAKFSRGSDPPQVKSAKLEMKKIQQSTPRPGSINTITVSIICSIDASIDEGNELDLTLGPFPGARFHENANLGASLEHLCKGGSEWVEGAENGPEIIFRRCEFKASQKEIIVFQVLNPYAIQDSPSMFILPECSTPQSSCPFGSFDFELEKAEGTFFGINQYYEPMRVSLRKPYQSEMLARADDLFLCFAGCGLEISAHQYHSKYTDCFTGELADGLSDSHVSSLGEQSRLT